MNKPAKLIKELFLGITNNLGELISLMKLSGAIAIKYPKEAAAIFYYSLESLNSAYSYRRKGKKITGLQQESTTISLSKKVYILGSGPSVNMISEDQWAEIGESDSWGFNVWFPHFFVPKVYFVQSIPENNSLDQSSYPYRLNHELKNMLQDKHEQYKNVKLYARGDASNKGKFYTSSFGEYLGTNFPANLYHLSELIIPSYSSIPPNELYETMFDLGFFSKKKSQQCIPKFGSTVGELISLALILGYKEIVLCGIDMNDGGHFYDHENYFDQYPYLREMYRINHSHKDKKHEHMDRDQRPFTIKDYILELNVFARNKFGAEIFVINESTILHPELRTYNSQ